MVLNEYIGNGQPWDLDRTFGGVHILPPYQGKNKTDWYRGTANAIFQNINFLKRYNPEYIIILSGDHIYKMDYSKMLDFHKEKNSEATIAVIEVPFKEASRFGIMNTGDDMRIKEFQEKPANPKSNKASMGIYIFNAEVLYKYLEEDDNDSTSQNDFGKNIIPKMLNDDIAMYAYPFSGYWKDVGTIDSLWEANMDLLGEDPNFNIFDKSWKIYSRNEAYPPQFLCEGSHIENSLITVGCYIEGEVINSLLSENVKIGKNAKIIDSILFDNVIVEEGAVIEYSIIADGVFIRKNARIGASKESGNKITVVGSSVTVDESCQVKSGEMIEKDVRK